MKKLLIVSTMLLSTSVLADAAGGPNCGWGNMLFKGQSGVPSHVLAATTNNSTGNNTIGMTFDCAYTHKECFCNVFIAFILE